MGSFQRIINTPSDPCKFYVHCSEEILPHSHREMEILLILKGSMTLVLDSQSLTVNEGSVFFINSNILHYGKSLGENMIRVGCLFDSEKFENIFPGFSKRKYYLEGIASQESLNEITCTIRIGILYMLIQHLLRLPGYRDTNAAFSYLLSTYIYLNVPSVENPQVPRSIDTKQIRLQEITAYICNHLQDPITLESLSDTFHINKFYLFHILRDELMCTFKQYLVWLRLEKAKQMLLQSDRNQEQIALQCGFPNQSSFYLAFKRYYHCTPSFFRKAHGNEMQSTETDEIYESILKETIAYIQSFPGGKCGIIESSAFDTFSVIILQHLGNDPVPKEEMKNEI